MPGDRAGALAESHPPPNHSLATGLAVGLAVGRPIGRAVMRVRARMTTTLHRGRAAVRLAGGLAAALVGILSALPAQAGEPPLPPDAMAVLQRRFPGLRVLARARGPLHVPSRDDWVVVLGRGERGARLVAVLWAEPAGWRLADASGDIDAACPGCEVAVRVRDGLLEVSTSDPGAAVARLVGWRFAYRGARRDVLRLVAVRHELVWHAGGDGASGAAAVVDDVASTDLLTGDKLDVIDGPRDGHPTRLEARSRVPVRQVIPFDQFGFDLRAAGAETRLVFGRDFRRR